MKRQFNLHIEIGTIATAKMYALEKGTSVSALVQKYLDGLKLDSDKKMQGGEQK